MEDKEYRDFKKILMEIAKKSIQQINAEEFISNHKYVNYCEAIIYRDGTISYVKPSHIQTLIIETGMSEEEIYDLMPITASPIEWLISYTGCIAVWYDFIKTPKNITKEQIDTINKLVEGKVINLGG